jgi:hypothetical protein
MGMTTKEITNKLLDMMKRSHRAELGVLVRRRQITDKFAKDITFAYGEGAGHMLHHLVEMGIVEYVNDDAEIRHYGSAGGPVRCKAPSGLCTEAREKVTCPECLKSMQEAWGPAPETDKPE